MPPTEFVGVEPADTGCRFRVISIEPMIIEVISLSKFWLCPSRNRGIQPGQQYEIARVSDRHWNILGPGMPWWSFNDDGTMHSH